MKKIIQRTNSIHDIKEHGRVEGKHRCLKNEVHGHIGVYMQRTSSPVENMVLYILYLGCIPKEPILYRTKIKNIARTQPCAQSRGTLL